MNGRENAIQCNIQSDAITLTTLNYSATVIVHNAYNDINNINLFITCYRPKHKFNA